MNDYDYLKILSGHHVKEVETDELYRNDWFAQVTNTGGIFRRLLLPEQKYLIEYRSYDLPFLVHEMMHVLDNIGSSRQLSNKKDFDFIVDKFYVYFDNLDYELDEYSIAYTKDRVELFARLLNLWLVDQGEINTYCLESVADMIVVDFYAMNIKDISMYFESKFPLFNEVNRLVGTNEDQISKGR